MFFTWRRGAGEASTVFSSASIVTKSANICGYKLILLFLSLIPRILITDNSNRSRGYKKSWPGTSWLPILTKMPPPKSVCWECCWASKTPLYSHPIVTYVSQPPIPHGRWPGSTLSPVLNCHQGEGGPHINTTQGDLCEMATFPAHILDGTVHQGHLCAHHGLSICIQDFVPPNIS